MSSSRSKTYIGPGQQCCYDAQFKLLTDPESQRWPGSADRYAPSLLNGFYVLHYLHDVLPYQWAEDLGEEAIREYFKYRPASAGVEGSC